MTNKATKYGLMTIAAVLLVAMAFAGAGVGAPLDITADDQNLYSVVSETTGNLETKTAHGLSVLSGDKKVYLIQSVAEWTEIATNESIYNGTILILGKNLDFSTTDSYMIPYRFNGSIYGNGYFIENFSNTSNAEPNVGLIREAGNGLNLNYVQMKNSSFESSNTSVGSLIGRISEDSNVTVIGCSVIDGNIKTNTNAGWTAGGMVGSASLTNGKVILMYSKVVNTKVITQDDTRQAGGLIGYGTRFTIAYCNVTDCSVSTHRSNAGGLIGIGSSGQIKGCNVVNCTVKTRLSYGWYTGGMIGNLASSTVEDCNVVNCSVTSGSSWGSEAGGLIGVSYGDVQISRCNVVDCSVSAIHGYEVGGVVGRSYYTIAIDGCNVTNCVIACGTYMAGGIIGLANNCSIENCEVADCVKISSGYSVGGLLGATDSGALFTFNGNKVTNSTIIGTSIASSDNRMGGLVGSAMNPDSEVNNNIIENVQVKATGSAPQYAYLFDTTIYPINHTNGITRFSQINLANDNSIINSIVLNKTGKENTRLEGFEGLTTEFAINVSNPLVTTIDDDTFKDSYLTGLSNISSVTAIGTNAFAGSKLAAGFYIPSDISIQDNALSQTSHLQILYNNSSVSLTGLDANTIVYNLTETAAQINILPGSFPLVEIQLNPNGGNGGTSVVTTAKDSNLLHSPIQLPTRAGYTFFSWNNENNGGVAVIDSTGLLESNVDGYTGDSGVWINTSSTVTLYANWTVNTTNVTAYGNVAEFHNENITAISSVSGSVVKVLLENVSQVTDTAVNFTADNTSVGIIPDIDGTTKEQITIFEINATAASLPARFNMTVTFKDEQTATAEKGKIHFWHYNSANNAWDSPYLTIVSIVQTGADVLYTVETNSFSPFGFGIYTAIPQQYTPSSSKQTGSTIILQEGQVAPTAYATATPTVAPTVKPTEQPATPTVIATAKPTTQATQSSPAPFVGLLAGLGAVAVLLRMRK